MDSTTLIHGMSTGRVVEIYLFIISRNRVVHIIFVPMLFWSFMVCIAHLPIIVLFERLPFNFSFAVTFAYIFYYILLEPVAGVIMMILLLILNVIYRLFLLPFS